MMDAFKSWMYSGVRYVAVPNGNGGSSVIAETGEHYGSWLDVAEFRRRQKQGFDELLVLGRAELRVVHIANDPLPLAQRSGGGQKMEAGA
jgi:hypothetical protein